MTKNILFISMDDCAAYWDYRSVFKEKLQTPNLDRICERASVFRAAYCAAPLCGPSRASLMSGLAPHQSGVVSNNDYVFNHISPKQMWSFDLKKHGYFCSSGGKVHHYFGAMDEKYHKVLYDDAPKSFPLFDWTPTKFKSAVALGGHRGGYATTDPDEDSHYYDAHSADSAISFLNSYNDDAPFYREVGFYSPHGPRVTPIRFKDLYNVDNFTRPAEWELGFSTNDFTKYELRETPELAKSDHSWWQHSVRNYFSAVSHVDYHIGRVWDALQASRHAQNTIVVILSDHGFHLGNLNRFLKKTLWEQAARVPLIVFDPANPQGQEIYDPVSLIDVGPTVLDYTDSVAPRKNSLGKSLRPLIRGRPAPQRAIPTFLRDNVAIRYGKYRLIRYRDGSTQLYNLKKNYWQQKDLGISHRGFAHMEAQLYETSKEWGFDIPERKLVHPLVPMAEIGKPIPNYGHKNIPHATYMANINTDTENHAMNTEPLSKHGQKQPLGVLTMVYKDYFFLERWYKYYKDQIGAENIYIYSHGNDPRHREIAPDANVMNVPRDETFTLFEVNRWRMMGFFASAMLEFYRYMIVSDVDEFVIADPKTGGNVYDYIQKHYLTAQSPKNISPLGLEIIHVPEHEPLAIEDGESFLSRRRFFRPNRNYSKPCIVGGPVSFGPGGHRNTLGPRHMPEDLYLLHLKFFDLPTIERRAQRQLEILQTAEDSGGIAVNDHPWARTLQNYHAIIQNADFKGTDVELKKFRDRMRTKQTEKFPRQYVWGYFKTKEIYELPQRFSTVL